MQAHYSRFVALVALAVGALAKPLVRGDAQAIEEDTLKAVYTYQLGKFTEWPATKLSPSETSVTYCILGRNPFSPTALEAIQGKAVKGRRLTIAIYPSGLLSNEAISACHVLFVSGSEKSRLRGILAQLEKAPVLTVSDIEGFARSGGMVALVTAEYRIGIEINTDALRKAGLVVSSKLLELAKVVSEREPGRAP